MAGTLWANPFSRFEEVVAKAEREGCLMLIIAPEWPGPQYPLWAALCALCPNRWQLPQDRPLYLRGVTDLIPALRWRTWAVLLESMEGSQAQMHPPHPSPSQAPHYRRRPGARTRAPNSLWPTATRTRCPKKSARDGAAQAGRETLLARGASQGRPYHMVGRQTPPFPAGPPRLGPLDTHPPAGGGASQFRCPTTGGTLPGRSRPSGHPEGFYGNRPGTGTFNRAG